MYIFGYGSLMNPESLQKTLPGKSLAGQATLKGYQRKMNMPIDGNVYLNIVPKKNKTVQGVLIKIEEQEFECLKERERGYDDIDVSGAITPRQKEKVFAFIAPNRHCPDMKILRSYVETCLCALPEEERDAWLKETIVKNEIEEDLEKPRYARHARG